MWRIFLISTAILSICNADNNTALESVFTPIKNILGDVDKMGTQITISIGDFPGGGCDCKFHMILYDVNGKSREVVLSRGTPSFVEELFQIGRLYIQRASENVYNVSTIDDLDDIDYIDFWPISGVGYDMVRPATIEVHQKKNGRKFYFPINTWLESGQHHLIQNYGASLPKNDPFKEQREKKLLERRADYPEAIVIKGAPPLCGTVRSGDKFDENYTMSFLITNTNAAIQAFTDRREYDAWESFDQIKDMYHGLYTAPKYSKNNFRSDVWFGIQRVQGINPALLRMVVHRDPSIPDALINRIGHVADDIEVQLEGFTYYQAVERNRIFIVDLTILSDLIPKFKVEVPAPIALFYVSKKKVLLPIAICLFPLNTASDEYPPIIYTPEDDANVWQLAKFYYNLAESAHHQAIAHFGFCHLLMEYMTTVTNRHLSLTHPIYRLLRPHFIFTISINHLAIGTLVKKKGMVDDTMTIGSEGVKYMAGKGFTQYNMTAYSNVIVDMHLRNVTKENLPYYPYRDDILGVYKMIRKYVKAVVDIYYKDDSDVTTDEELRSWRLEMSQEVNAEDPNNVTGYGLRGVPGSNITGLETKTQLIDLATIIICTASARHATVNFLQYDMYGFPPNYPAFLSGPILNSREPITDQELLSYLPKRERVAKTLLLTTLLSTITTKYLGDYREQMLFHPKATEALEILREDIRQLNRTIARKNEVRHVEYDWCNPIRIPNGVSV